MTKEYTLRVYPITSEAPTHSVAPTVNVSFRKEIPHIPSTTYSVFSLYRYPAKFIPQAVAYVIERYATPTTRVLDPFAGSGTTGLVARLYGLGYELWDLNPLLGVLHEIAIMRPPSLDPEAVVSRMKRTRRTWRPKWAGLDYWYPEQALELLEKAWGYYHSLDDKPLRLLITVPLLKLSKLLSYNDPQRQKLSRSPKAVERVKELLQGDYRARFYNLFREELVSVLAKLREYQRRMEGVLPPQSRVLGGVDSIEMARALPQDAAWDMLITSPPYLQAQEYIRYSKLELYWLGYSEEEVRQLGKRELPYQKVEPFPIHSEQYEAIRSQIEEPHLRAMYERYFHGVLGTLTRLSERVEGYLCLFVGRATVRGKRVPIDAIFEEHFKRLGWVHEATLVDEIRARVMFRSSLNPATGIEDHRMPTEHMVILKRRE
ncbi:MAG: DNA methyltransferase [Thermus sp.]|uniref:DNA methyltransferase n=1 Tax=Thermus sp. TaxID=275 RepID=UPI00391ACFD2